MENKQLKIQRVKAPPSKDTFTIKPIAELLQRYVKDGKGWIDPFAGENSPAELTNDLNPSKPTKYHLKSDEFCNQLNGEFEGILLDPPYSPRQIKECYNGIGIKCSATDTQNAKLYGDTRKSIYKKIKVGGYAISFGWNSTGFGKNMGFEIVEILLVNHSSAHNDTIVVVEKKVQNTLSEEVKQEAMQTEARHSSQA